MNKVILMGNLTKDPERRTTESGTSVTSFRIAVTRNYKNASGEYDADFINCVAWRRTADFVAQYVQKGMGICLVGSLQTRTYTDRDGAKRYVTEVMVEDAEFTGPRNGAGREAAPAAEPKKEELDPFEDELGDFVPLDDDKLPF